MKMLQKIATVVLGLCLALCVNVIPAFASDDIDMLDIKDNDFYVKQKQSIEIYNQLLDFLQANTISSEDDEKQYPDYYGGAYIDDNGELVVLIKDINNIENATLAFSSKSNFIHYQNCDVSYNEILDVINLISNNLNYFTEQNVNIVYTLDNIMNGTVIVGIEDLTLDKEQIVKNFTGCSFICFENADAVKFEESFGAGYTVHNENKGTDSTLGFCATMNGVKGFVIAGHAGNKNGLPFSISNTLIGNVTKTAIEYTIVDLDKQIFQTDADAAFIKANNGIDTTHIAKNGGSIWNASTYQLPINTEVCKYGCATQFTSGHIIGNAGQYYAKDYLTGKTHQFVSQGVADYGSASGDSGSPIMIYEGNYGGQSKYTLYGIHSGSSNSNDKRFFSFYRNIKNRLGVVCITE